MRRGAAPDWARWWKAAARQCGVVQPDAQVQRNAAPDAASWPRAAAEAQDGMPVPPAALSPLAAALQAQRGGQPGRNPQGERPVRRVAAAAVRRHRRPPPSAQPRQEKPPKTS